MEPEYLAQGSMDHVSNNDLRVWLRKDSSDILTTIRRGSGSGVTDYMSIRMWRIH